MKVLIFITYTIQNSCGKQKYQFFLYISYFKLMIRSNPYIKFAKSH